MAEVLTRKGYIAQFGVEIQRLKVTAFLEAGSPDAKGSLDRAERYRDLLIEAEYLDLRRYRDVMTNSWLNIVEGWVNGSPVRLAGYRDGSVQYSGARDEQELPMEEVGLLMGRYLPVLVKRNVVEGIQINVYPLNRLRSLFFRDQLTPFQAERIPVQV